MANGLQYINNSYGLNAKRGDRVLYTGGKTPRYGTITGAKNGHLCVRLDGQKHSKPYHPTWELKILKDA